MLEIPKPDELKAAYNKLTEAFAAQAEAEEAKNDAQQALDKKFSDVFEDAKADELPDARAQQKALKATRDLLTAFHVAEKNARRASTKYRMAGIQVDCMNRLVDLARVATKAHEIGEWD